MPSIERSIELEVPVRVAYEQWTQFEEFPRFMSGVKEVRQIDEKHVHWVAEVGGDVVEWDAEIVEQVPDHLVAWRSTSGTPNRGSVRFEPTANGSRLTVEIEHEPVGIKQRIGALIDAPGVQVEDDLLRFRTLIEHRQEPTGAWRGRILQGEVVDDAPMRRTRPDHLEW